ncbi:MAG: hypothetical protein J1E98_14305 [Lachnospiraceae bacterium]|nr:hypothetical protein [Lachnospiraceae bacterium]
MFQWLPSSLVAGIEAKKRKYDPGSKLDLEAFDIKEDVLGGEHDHEQIIALDKWMNQYNNIHRRAVSNGEKVDTAELQKSRPLINGTINMLTLKSRSASLTRKTRSKKRKKSSSKRFRKRCNVINSIKWKSPRTRFRKTLYL